MGLLDTKLVAADFRFQVIVALKGESGHPGHERICGNSNSSHDKKANTESGMETQHLPNPRSDLLEVMLDHLAPM